MAVFQTLQMDLCKFRVWPDGTTQPVEDAPHDLLSDDFTIVIAADEEEARSRWAFNPGDISGY